MVVRESVQEMLAKVLHLPVVVEVHQIVLQLLIEVVMEVKVY